MWTPAAPLAGAAALACLTLTLKNVGPATRWLAVVLLGIGAASLGATVALGARPAPADLLSVNQGVVGMIAAVSFIQLVTPPGRDSGRAGVGARAVWRTAGLVHGLGAVINLAIVDIVGRHLRAGRAHLHLVDGLLLSRAFSAAAFWSPFWASSATALAYAPEADPTVLLGCGLMLAFAALGLSITGLVRSFPHVAHSYAGYSVTPTMLALPGVLLLVVVIGHNWWKDVPVSTVVLLASVFVTATILVLRVPRSAPSTLMAHIRGGLPRMRGEVTLFTAAGVMSVGLSTLTDHTGLEAPIGEFTVLTAWAAVALMAAASLVGIHPVVSIAALATLLEPSRPDPTLFALAAVIAWGSSAAVGPISGLNVYLSGRFGLDGFEIARHNLRYVTVVVVLALPTLAACRWLLAG